MAGHTASPTGQVMWPSGTELTGVHQQEAAGAHELVRLLGGDALGDLAGGSGLGDDLFVLVVLVVGGRDPVLEDGVEVGLDVVGVELVVVVLVLLALLAGGAASSPRPRPPPRRRPRPPRRRRRRPPGRRRRRRAPRRRGPRASSSSSRPSASKSSSSIGSSSAMLSSVSSPARVPRVRRVGGAADHRQVRGSAFYPLASLDASSTAVGHRSRRSGPPPVSGRVGGSPPDARPAAAPARARRCGRRSASSRRSRGGRPPRR